MVRSPQTADKPVTSPRTCPRSYRFCYGLEKLAWQAIDGRRLLLGKLTFNNVIVSGFYIR